GEREDTAAVGRDLDRHAFAHAAETVEQVMADELEIPGDRPAVAADRTFRGGGPWGGFICRRFLGGRLFHRLLGLGSLLRHLLACDFHSTLHALTSREALARLRVAGEVASPSQAVRPGGPGLPRPRSLCGGWRRARSECHSARRFGQR